MKRTHPRVILIARPSLDIAGLTSYLAPIGGVEWLLNRRLDAKATGGVRPFNGQDLVEFAGRLCYRSWVPGLNPNVTKVREDQGEYLTNILASGHGSVLEHANYTFVFHNVSRVFTHELVRHRAGVAISQESLRFVRLTDIGFYIPPVLADKPGMTEQIVSIVERLEEFQRTAAEEFGLDDEGVPFHYKKEVTSALRRLAPIGLSTGMVWTANIRTLRHVIAMRTAKGAEQEIRQVFDGVGHLMRHECPDLFGDFKVNDDGEWVPEYEKV